ncbi:uncharacterized protein LOC106079241 [Biomphalaria glabrata]|uniref:Uncharacterized protein LOC106079241 n=1 Tax=Biomphalaria glabrata TaxID=6526 RepID=A0A9W3A9P5_BIOGL|nr:uncharacterized protein LOC106079241 [Biomphalaria glabrata]
MSKHQSTLTNPANQSRPRQNMYETGPGTSLSKSSPPYYNVTNQASKYPGSTSSGLQPDKSISYIGFQQLQETHPQAELYSQLSVVDHYELLAPVQNNSIPSLAQARKKCVCLAACCILVGLVVVLATLLGTLLGVGKKLDNNFNAKFSSFVKSQSEIQTNLLASLCSSKCNESPDVSILTSHSCYCLYRKQLSWNSAREFCLAKGNGVHLAEIYTQETNDFLIPILQASQTNIGIWLGGSDLNKENVWRWNYSGTVLETFEPRQWGLGEPSQVRPGFNYKEHCLEVYNHTTFTFQWNDHACEESDLKPFLCQSSTINSQCLC